MAVTQSAPAVAARPSLPVRKIERSDLRQVLREGFGDFLTMRGDLMFAALLYPLIGLVAAVVFMGGPLLPLFFPIAAGVALLGPIAAIGFYELARRRESGDEADWTHFLDVRKRPAFDNIVVVSMVLLVLFAAWLVAAGALFVSLWGPGSPESLGQFVSWLFATREGWALILLGNLIGIFFALAVLAISVASLPMLVDRDVEAGTAMSVSVAAVRENFPVMIRWGLIVVALLVLGSIPFFIGLAVVLPWLGYATWHLYTRLIDRSALPIRGAAS